MISAQKRSARRQVGVNAAIRSVTFATNGASCAISASPLACAAVPSSM